MKRNKIKKIKLFLKNRLTNLGLYCIIISTKNKTPNQIKLHNHFKIRNEKSILKMATRNKD